MSLKINNIFCSVILFVALVFSTVAQERVVEVNTVRNNDNTVDFFYVKNKPGSYTLKLKFNDLTNCSQKEHIEVLQYDSGKIVTLIPLDKNKGIGYSYTVLYRLGNAKPKVDSLFQYILPVRKGIKSRYYESDNMNEKYYGSEKNETWKSYFVRSKTPDTVFAMRKGIVVDIVNKFETDTLVKATTKKNKVVVEHADGTYAIYKNLELNSIKVALGETVCPATPIGIMDRITDNSYIFNFSVYYISSDVFDKDPEASMKSAKSSYSYLTPYFYTQEGLLQISPKSDYTADDTEQILTQELSKKELKKRSSKK